MSCVHAFLQCLKILKSSQSQRKNLKRKNISESKSKTADVFRYTDNKFL